jgi:tyrosine-protein phosphatase SIW14
VRLIRKLLLASALVAFSLATPAPAQPIERDGPSPGSLDTSKIRIRNFGRINERYYRGAQPKGRDYLDLAALGVRTVVNLTSDDAQEGEREMVEGAGMTYVQIPMTTHEPPTAAKLAAFLKVIDDPASQPVYVHCVGGRHRTGVMTAVYRMTRHGWAADQAFQEMKQYDFGADFLHPEFKTFVFGFGRQMADRSGSNAVVAPAK